MRKQNTEAGFGSYTVLLIRLGFVSPRATPQDCWGMWCRLVESPEILKRVKKRMGRNFSGSVSGYSHGAAVLAAMSKRDLASLRERLGIRPEKEFAVIK